MSEREGVDPIRGTSTEPKTELQTETEQVVTEETVGEESLPEIQETVGVSEGIEGVHNIQTPGGGKRLNALTVSEKDALCRFKHDNPSVSNTALKAYAKAEFNKEPSSSQVSRILQEAEKWAGKQGRRVNARKVRLGKWPALETGLTILLNEERHTGQNITTGMILQKARALAPEMGIRDFTGSNTWAENFRRRTGFSVPSPLGLIPSLTQVLNAPSEADMSRVQQNIGLVQNMPPNPDMGQVREDLNTMDPQTNVPPSSDAQLGSDSHANNIQVVDPVLLARVAQTMQNAAMPPPMQNPIVSFEEAHHAAFLLAAFMEQNGDKFSMAEQLHFERGIRAELSKHLIDKMAKAASKPE